MEKKIERNLFDLKRKLEEFMGKMSDENAEALKESQC